MRRITVLVTAALLCAALVLATVAAAAGPPGYVVKGTASGGRYHLVATRWQASGIAGGGGYRLVSPVSPTGTGTPCCCNYLPCVLR